MVENEALVALRVAVERAIFRTIAFQEEHRLPFESWRRAHELGIALPEAADWLHGWKPVTADAHGASSAIPCASSPRSSSPAARPTSSRILPNPSGTARR